MSQRQQLERIMEIDRQVREKLYPNPNQLAQDLEVSRRVIFVDRDFMIHRLGAPIKFDRAHNGWYYADETWVLPGIIVTQGELLAFFLSIEIARRYFGTALEETLNQAVQKLARNVNGSISVDLETLRSHYSFSGPTSFNNNDQAFVDIHQAIASTRRVRMRYYTASRGDETERTVHPYHLANIRGDWYLIAFDEFRQEIRNFSIGRIKEWEILNDKFRRNENFKINDYMGAAFNAERRNEPVDVLIRFDAQSSRYIREKQWHPSQKIEDLEDGGTLFRIQTTGLGELKRWVLQYGSSAEILEPTSLRQEFAQEAQKLLKLYSPHQ